MERSLNLSSNNADGATEYRPERSRRTKRAKDYVLCLLEGEGDIAPGGLALRFNGDVPSMHVDGAIAVAKGATGPGKGRAPLGTGSSSSVVCGSSSMLGRASASSASISISSSSRGDFLAFLRVLLGVRVFFLSVSSPFSTMRHISTATGAFSRMSIQILKRYQYRVNSTRDMRTRWFS